MNDMRRPGAHIKGRAARVSVSRSQLAIAASRLFRALEELGPGPTAEMFAAGRHSRRSASIGCTCAARRAGIQLAPSATINSRPAALDSVTRSDDPMPKRTDFTNRADRIDAPTPMAI